MLTLFSDRDKGIATHKCIRDPISAAAEADANQSTGKIEHVASGLTATFESLEELPQLLLKMLRSVDSPEGR
jgi:hypothetical protein